MNVYQLLFLESIIATLVAIFIIFWFIKKRRVKKFKQNQELINKLNDDWVSDREKEKIKAILREKGKKGNTQKPKSNK